MRKSREFDNILDDCLERLLVKGETVEQCLQSFPEHGDALKPLLEAALVAKQAAAIQPRPEFKDRARRQFHLVLQRWETKRGRLLSGWQLRWATVAAVVLALLLVGGGTVVAASSSMPDEPLYPVKLATEQVRLVLTPSALGKAELYAKLADRRVVEIVHMAAKSKPMEIERTARYLNAHLTRIADLASVQGVMGGRAMVPALEAVPSLAERAKGVKEARIRGDYRIRLRGMMVRHASQQPARLRALLETVPPSARPALLRAIAVSEISYEQVLESLED